MPWPSSGPALTWASSISEDQNHPESTGISPRARNTIDGVRMSMALTYLEQARHRLNLTVRGGVTARRVLFEGTRAVGVEAESGGEIFAVEGEQIVVSSGAIGSPHLLLLSGVGPAEQIGSFGIDVVPRPARAWARTCGTIPPPPFSTWRRGRSRTCRRR